MNYFLDTNVELGFVFCTDPWNDKSNIVFNKQDNLYYSSCVDKEFCHLYRQILHQQKIFFIELRNILDLDKNHKQINLDDLIIKSWQLELNYDFEQNKKDRCIEVFWKFCKKISKSGGSLDEIRFKVKDIIQYITRFIRDFERTSFNRRLQFENRVMFHSGRTDNYHDIYEKLINSGVHNPDTFIILDAHDLSLKESIALEFISADNNMIQNVNPMLNYLNIDKFHYLKDFC